MKRFNWQMVLGLTLIVLSVAFYFFHYLVFRDSHHIFIYLLGDVAFVPIEVLLVTLIIHQLLSAREKRHKFQKLNMVIGAFFSEVGTRLLAYFSDFDRNLSKIRKHLIVEEGWTDNNFRAISKRLNSYGYEVEIERVDLESLKNFLAEKRDFLLRLLENPNLLEHESFTDLLNAVFHLTEELSSRADLNRPPQKDRQHLGGDIKRAYGLLVREWLSYMKHLKKNYPYLFSLAMRTNPFDQNASPVVR